MSTKPAGTSETGEAASQHHTPAGEDELFEMLYAELRRLAARQLAREPGSVTLNPTALVHDAFVRFRVNPVAHVHDGRHFVRLVARVMRQLLIDRARRRKSAKRGSEPLVVTLSEEVVANPQPTITADELIELDRALKHLHRRDPDMATLVELRFFGGLSNGQIAEIMDISGRSVSRLWQSARAWLTVRMRA